MKMYALGAAAVLASTLTAYAQTPKLPKDAVQLNGDQIIEWLDNRTFQTVTIYDASVPITASIKWNSAKKRVSGSYDAGGTKGTFDNEWILNGDTICSEKTSDGEWICQRVFIVGDLMYEVNSKGKVHAVSKP